MSFSLCFFFWFFYFFRSSAAALLLLQTIAGYAPSGYTPFAPKPAPFFGKSPSHFTTPRRAGRTHKGDSRNRPTTDRRDDHTRDLVPQQSAMRSDRPPPPDLTPRSHNQASHTHVDRHTHGRAALVPCTGSERPGRGAARRTPRAITRRPRASPARAPPAGPAPARSARPPAAHRRSN